MKKKINYPLWIAIIVLVAVAAYFGGFLTIASVASPHYVIAGGQNYTLTAIWGDSAPSCRLSNYVKADILTTDQSNTTAKVDVKMPFTTAYPCQDAYATLSVNLTSVNIQQYQRVVVHRKVTWTGTTSRSLYGDGPMGLTSTVIDMVYKKTQGPATTVSGSLSDVFFTNDGSTITMNGDEGRKVYDATKPLFFTNTVTLYEPDAPGNGGFNYEITSVELTPLGIAPSPYAPPAPAPIIAPNPQVCAAYVGGNCTGNTPVAPPAVVPSVSLWSTIWTAIVNFFASIGIRGS